MERWQNRVAAVTGASSGIGAAIAKDLVNAGLIVVGLARRTQRVEEIRSSLATNLQTRLHVVKCDVSDLQSVNEAFDWIEKNLGGVDVLVNNAGTYTAGQLLTMDIGEVEKTLQTNLMGMVYCTRRTYESMQKRQINDGHVVLINSIVGHHVFNLPPGVVAQFNIYPASKHGVTGLTEILRQEFRDLKTKIKITSVSPGLVDTEIVPESYQGLPMLKPEDISAGVMYAIATPPHVQVHELTIKPVGETF
ncbi:farnesol dehydrogenase-like [Musca vetustissima]|uniref:farnesol dehydrogenase-like n=1 Tax=Musca vetustissima TaxID=27455 RepID=UPI002AB67BCF|nr:farnesol dehydrogenase-like [Musca vetustissima]